MKATTARRALPVLALALAGMALTACGAETGGASSSSTSAPASAVAGADTSSGNSSTAGSAADGTSSSTSADSSGGQNQGSSSGTDGGPQTCTAAHLKVSAENIDTGAGTTHFQLLFQNTGSSPCTLSGFPGVSFHGGDGAQIGNAAARDTSASVTTVTLLPNGHAASDVTAPNGQSGFSASQCRLKDVSFVGVYAPGSKDLIDVPWKTQECSSTSVHALKVGPVHSVR
ncbi:DUF4232 domain-containing protein [Streptomyces sp. NPDC001980]|uniref:DUF4232 domain-containing protein n=1 Tax=Streptomyces sp. NPDC001980 TaxID=3157126 RepID=UPI00332E8DB7